MTNYITNITYPSGTQTVGGTQFDDGWVNSVVSWDTFTLAQESEKTFDLSEILPADGYDYEIVLNCHGSTKTTSGNAIAMDLNPGSIYNSSTAIRACRCVTRTSSSSMTGGNVNLCILANNRSFTVYNNGGSGSGTSGPLYVSLKKYRRIGTNDREEKYIEKINVSGTSVISVPIGGKIIDSGWVRPSNKDLWTSGSFSPTVSSREIDLSSILPNDGYNYDCLITVTARSEATSGKYCSLWLKSDFETGTTCVGRVMPRSNAYRTVGKNALITVGTRRKLYLHNSDSADSNVTNINVYLTGYKRVGSNNGTGIGRIETPDNPTINYYAWYNAEYSHTVYTMTLNTYSGIYVYALSNGVMKAIARNGQISSNVLNVNIGTSARSYNRDSSQDRTEAATISSPINPFTINAFKTGSPTIDGSVISGFSANNYLTIPSNLVSTNNAEYIFCITTDSDISTDQPFVHGDPTVDMSIGEGYLRGYNYSTNQHSNIVAVSPNTKYWCKEIVNGTTKSYSYSTNGTTWSTPVTITDTKAADTPTYGFTLGRNSYGRYSTYFSGSIDLSECLININGTKDWTGITKSLPLGGRNFYGPWVYKNQTVFSSETFTSTQTKAYTISNYLPDNYYYYEVVVTGYVRTSTTSANGMNLWVTSNPTSNSDIETGYLWQTPIGYGNTRTSSSAMESGNTILICKQDSNGQFKILAYHSNSDTSGSCGLYLKSYRRIGTVGE